MDLVNLCEKVAEAALQLAIVNGNEKNEMLEVMAKAIESHRAEIIEQNSIDMASAKDDGRDDAFLDRLALNDKRIDNMAEGLRQLINLADPIGAVTEQWRTEIGLDIKKMRVPLGVVAIIYEARPNVTADAVGLCIKSGNAVILKGSKDAHCSNKKIAEIMKKALVDNGFCSDIIAFVDDKSRESTKELLKLGEYIDVTIPRGGNALKKFVLEHSTMPVIASAGGNCHIYVEKTANAQMALDIIINAKCQRPSVCNAVEQLLVDKDIASTFLPFACNALAEKGVKLRGDEGACSICELITRSTEEDYYTETISLILTIKVVDSYKEAISRINKYGTKHSDAIITENKEAVDAFMKGVDSACLYHNASTRFTDGFMFGFGAEMAISTQKLHVRGPMGLIALTSEKYIIEGNGNIRK